MFRSNSNEIARSVGSGKVGKIVKNLALFKKVKKET